MFDHFSILYMERLNVNRLTRSSCFIQGNFLMQMNKFLVGLCDQSLRLVRYVHGYTFNVSNTGSLHKNDE